jgi:hypothetical protein
MPESGRGNYAKRQVFQIWTLAVLTYHISKPFIVTPSAKSPWLEGSAAERTVLECANHIC